MAGTLSLFPASSLQCLLLSFTKFTPKICVAPNNSSAPAARSRSVKACLGGEENNGMMVKHNYRPLANFHPSIWKDAFFSIPSDDLELESYQRQIEVVKEQVREMITAASTKDPVEEVSLINSLCRLGVSYHFESVIEDRLKHIFEALPNLAADGDYDLCTVALVFQVFRRHGFKMSCGVFDKFKDKDGKFKENLTRDVRGLLSLYEATQFRVHGENILEEALSFTTAHLKPSATNSSPHLAKYIIDALELPFHRSVPRLEAYKYVCFYAHDESRNGALLKFAKLDFNRVQLLHRQELSYLTSWWNDLNFTTLYSYSRDRLVEFYFWSVAEYFEPIHSHDRLILTKIFMMLTVLDDTYDAYGTLEELHLFTEATERWDINAASDLPDYMKPLYCTLLNLFDGLHNDIAKDGKSYSVSYTKDKMIEIIRAYFVEAQWFREGFMPPFDERLSSATITNGCFLLPAAALIRMGEIAGINAFEWLQSRPKIVMSTFAAIRIIADMVSHEIGQERGHIASVVESYMKEYGTSRKETIGKLNMMIENAWKDLNEECMRPTIVPIPVLNTVLVNFLRLAEVCYGKTDGLTNAGYLKEYIIKLFINKMHI